MKKIILGFLIFALILNLATPAYCGGPLRKLGRGICNLATCPLEVFNRVHKVTKSEGSSVGLTYGLLEGLGMVCYRAAIGFGEVLTFPFPIPPGYEPAINDPEFFFNWPAKKISKPEAN